ncbi:glycosyltransferase family 39 protein [Ottowia caeni]|uniref:glycosyltransferase family 39 protein n=1 Tax=Ottowia caeni TaxID=2870339 RepID=UPI001E4C96C7|nr:glycosyltransferase family 39 protein [Ottowia caeni]
MFAAGANSHPNSHPYSAGEGPLVLNESRLPWLLGIFGAGWLFFLAWCALTPPFDNIEQLIWMRSLEWGYFKHPPLPTWILAAASWVVPAGPPLTYFLGACCILGAHAVFWHVLRDAHGPRVATAMLLASLCITFYNQRIHFYNHNVVMMPAIAVCVAMMWQLTRRSSHFARAALPPGTHAQAGLHHTPPGGSGVWWAWAVIGVAMGLGMLVKYQMALVGICIGLWWLRMRWWREPGHRWGLLLASVITSAIFLPHLLWLIHHDWLPLRYAEKSSLGVALSPLKRLTSSLTWVADWLLNRSMPAWLVLGATVGWAARRSSKNRAGAAEAQRAPTDSPDAAPPPVWRQFWLLFGLFPLLSMAALGLGFGADLQMHWGTAFAMWTLTVLLALAPKTLVLLRTPAAMRAVWVAFAVIQTLIVLQFWVSSPRGLPAYKTGHWPHFPSQEIADKLGPIARAELGGPIDIIAGRSAIAGAIALRLPEWPKVLINGDLQTSPWISAEELKNARVIEVFPALELPPGAHWLGRGFAWRVGLSPLSRLQAKDLRPTEPEPARNGN